MVFNGIIGSALKDFSNFSPLIVDNSVHQEKDPLLFFTPVYLLDKGVQVVVPSLTALLSNSVLQMLSNEGPLLWSISDNQLQDPPVFLLSPGSFNISTSFSL